VQGRLRRGDFVRIAYRLGRRALTGELEIVELGGKRHTLFVRRGYLAAAHVEGFWAPLGELLREAGHLSDEQLKKSLEAMAEGTAFQGRALIEQGIVSEAAIDDALRRQADLRLERLAAIEAGTWKFEPAAPPASVKLGGRPVALAHWARRFLDAHLNAPEARKLLGDLCMARFRLIDDLGPAEATLDDLDRRLCKKLLEPTNLAELLAVRGATRPRVLALLFFLAGVGALVAGTHKPAFASKPRVDPIARAHEILGVPTGSDADTIRKAYRNLVRTLHPDLHPGLPPVARRTLELRFAAVSAAYRSLTR
jgi:hypothetical protein